MGLSVLVALVVVMMGYIRLAPSDPVRWHVVPQIEADSDSKGGARRILPGSRAMLARLDTIARASPATKVLAGSVESGMITYVTRTRGFGFPDYTTIYLDGDQIKIHARLRFGRSDFGVNAARLKRWIDAL